MSAFGDARRSRRLRKALKSAAERTDPAEALELLRKARADLIGSPPDPDAEPPNVSGELLTGLVEGSLEQRFYGLLAEADFTELELVAGHSTRAEEGRAVPADAWRPLIAARDARGERAAACALLTRLYPILDPADPGGADVAVALARRRTVPDGPNAPADELWVYAEALGRSRVALPEIAALVESVLRVGFGTDKERIAQAGWLAQELARRNVVFPRRDTVLGLAHLVVQNAIDAAVTALTRAHQADPRDETAFAALMAALLRRGEQLRVVTLMNEPGRPASRRIDELSELSRTLGWLDDPSAAGPVPADSTRLSRLTIGEEAGGWLPYAIGRLRLLEGDTRQAAAALGPLAETTGTDPVTWQWGYHAAWAWLLLGDREAVAHCFSRVYGGPGGWTVACLLRDADPDRDLGGQVVRTIETAPPAFAAIAATRIGLADGRREPGEPPWQPGSGSLPEDLEALRTLMGLRAARRDGRLAETVRTPLFRRLPAQERLMWTGLSLMQTEPERGRELLEAAARDHGYGRAALVLAALDAEQGRYGTTMHLLDSQAIPFGAPGPASPTGLAGPKPQLLIAWARARGGREREAVEILEGLAAEGKRAAGFLLGPLRMREALALRAAGQPAEATRLAERAAQQLDDAVDAVPQRFRRDALFMMEGAAAFAGKRVEPRSAFLPSLGDHPWVVWVLAMSAVTSDPVHADVGLYELPLNVLDKVGRPPAEVVTAFAEVLATACVSAQEADRAATLTDLLGRLAGPQGHGHDMPEVRAAYELAIAARLRRAPDDGIAIALPEVPSSTHLALATSLHALRRGDPAEASRLLRQAPVADDAERRMCAAVADALEGNAVEEVPDGLPPELTHALEIAQAASLVETDPERCVQLVSAALVSPDAAVPVAALVDLDRVLPMLCAVPARDRDRSAAPSPLVDIVTRLADSPDASFSPLTLARCATAVGAFATAERLWWRALGDGDGVPEQARGEFARLLCHRAQLARTEGDRRSAAVLLRRAAHVAGGGLLENAPPLEPGMEESA
ncbi:hypothetical protein J4573_01220 [Actinomadura barringtoniae]|uniref:Tetratricopeptide repeat protein n=1 Tax=Actinomadura barringtoniae TaxID=1427535 RepID=A0A939T0N4_9ACTN|nr:hypothetical protein [Actinomadura barringtoniae]MBO2445701.1 hypothetical protein [Actinomadura barringtoniae]